MAGLDEFSGHRYLNLETYRRTGAGVRTPIWFAGAPDADGMRLYAFSLADSGKAKRIRRSGVVKIAACDMRGTVTGGWVEARASFGTDAEFDRGMRLLNRKYWPWKTMLDVLSRLRPGKQRVMIVIQPV